jgi:CheY-like chemotaxis protein
LASDETVAASNEELQSTCGKKRLQKITESGLSQLKKKILVVEDNSDSREIMNLFITKMGHRAIKAKNSNEAITFAEAEGPDLIFMDVQLPDVDGVQTTAMLKQNPKTSHIPVVALTASLSALWEEKASKVGIATYLIKPVSLQMLKETIEDYTNIQTEGSPKTSKNK